jgi:hypothetical protein
MVRGLADGLLTDLWNFPAAFGKSPAEALNALREKLSGLTRAPLIAPGARHGAPVLTLGKPLAKFRHGITYRAIVGRVYPVRYLQDKAAGLEGQPGATVFRHPSLHWFELADLPQAAISQLARKIVQEIA